MNPASEKKSLVDVIDYDDSLQIHFENLNREWIEKLFRVEDDEADILRRPRERLLERGGAILLARLNAPEGPRIVGTVALLPFGDGVYELTKMCVTESAQGLGIGRRLLQSAEERFRALGGKTLFLLTNFKCETAISLYLKFGFVEVPMTDADRLEYERCQLRMVLKRPVPKETP